jgi:hypothetical protein
MLPPSSSTHVFVSYHHGQICHGLHRDKISEINFHFPTHKARSSFRSTSDNFFEDTNMEVDSYVVSQFLRDNPEADQRQWGYSGGWPLSVPQTNSVTPIARHLPPLPVLNPLLYFSVPSQVFPVVAFQAVTLSNAAYIIRIGRLTSPDLSKLLDSLLSTIRNA